MEKQKMSYDPSGSKPHTFSQARPSQATLTLVQTSTPKSQAEPSQEAEQEAIKK
jgi:hypothetical protein